MVMKMKQEEMKVQENLISFGDWSEFAQKVRDLTEKDFETEGTLCHTLGIDEQAYQRTVRFSVAGWKESPSKSLLNGLGLNGIQLPAVVQNVFKDFLSQTRFLMIASQGRFFSIDAFHFPCNEQGKKLEVKGEYVRTLRKEEHVQRKLDELLQMLYTYLLYCKKQEEKDGFKQSKKLYRGVRLRDVFWIPEVEEYMKKHENELKNKSHEERVQIKIDLLIPYIQKHGLSTVCESNLVSFTSSKAIAKYFANGEGLIIEVNTDDVEILTSEAHDERFAERDMVSGKQEKEYIVRVTKEEIIPSTIIVESLSYFMATNNPLAVDLFDHNTKSATYELNGVNIKAYLVWTSNTTSTIRYKNRDADSWGLSVKEFKDKYGFSPALKGKALKEVKDFQVFHAR